MQTRKNSKLNLEEKEEEEGEEEEEEGEEEEKVDSLHTVFLELYPELIAYPCLFLNPSHRWLHWVPQLYTCFLLIEYILNRHQLYSWGTLNPFKLLLQDRKH